MFEAILVIIGLLVVARVVIGAIPCQVCKQRIKGRMKRHTISIDGRLYTVCSACRRDHYSHKRRAGFRKLRGENSPDTPEREHTRHISSHVKREVWRRDRGMCVQCGSREHIEYDHIIPYSKGGSNTARNIQLLCKECNRSKSARIM